MCIDEVIIIGLVAILATFVIQMSTISGWRERVQIYAPKPIHEMLSCDFCFGFWTAVVCTFFYCVYNWSMEMWYMPFITAPITRKVLK